MDQITNKERILKLKDIFFNETDEDHKLSFEEILDRLKLEYGPTYEISTKAIRDDLETLRGHDRCISESRNKYGKKMYSQQDRLFETNELRTLVDTVSSAGSISTRDKERVIDKIKMLTSKGIAASLSNQIYSELKVVNQDSSFRYNLDNIHMAIQDKNKIIFSYGRYDVNKKFILNEKQYIVHPYGLVWESGFYYLVAYDETKTKIINFRMDRIRKVSITEKPYKSDVEFKLSSHVNNCFNMYPGDVRSIEIKFHKHLINAIIDRFGVEANIKPLGEDHFLLYTRAAINTGLIRWILNWGSDAIVLKPERLVEETRNEIRKMNEMYED